MSKRNKSKKHIKIKNKRTFKTVLFLLGGNKPQVYYSKYSNIFTIKNSIIIRKLLNNRTVYNKKTVNTVDNVGQKNSKHRKYYCIVR